MNEDAEVKVLTTDEAAAFLRISPYTLEQWRSRSKGPPYSKIGRNVVYLQADLLSWLYQNRKVPQPQPQEV